MRVALVLSVMVVVLVGAASAQELDASLYRNLDYRFAVLFPGAPMERAISYTSKDGAAQPARQFYVEQGTNHYTVTVVDLSGGPEVDFDAVEFAAAQMRARGEVRFEYEMAYDPGMPGRQLNIFQPDGRQLRASTYMWRHNLYITEAVATPGDLAALKFEQSILLLEADGNPVDTGAGNCPIPRPE